ncbi:MAG TPA: alpha/beta hydrolase [Vicinamibacterales bacterium]
MARGLAILVVLVAGAVHAQQPSTAPPVLESFVDGTGRVVVLLDVGVHEAGGFEPHARALAPDFRIVRMQPLHIERAQKDLPLPAGYSMDIESEAMARALDRLGLTGPVDIVGASFGALVALDFALDQPERVRSLALFEPPAFWAMPAETIANDAAMRAMIEVSRELVPDAEPTDAQLAAFLCALGACGEEPPEDGTTELKVWEARRAALGGLSAVPNHRDSVERLKAFAKPVLLMTGAATVDFHRRINDHLATLLPRVERAEVAGGHDAPTSSREDFLAKWRAFVEKH